MKKTQEIIECPNCQVLQLAEIWQEERPFAIYIHNCESCGHLIMESEWNSVSAADVMAHITAIRAQLAQTWQPVPDSEAIDCECGTACHFVASNMDGGIMVSRRTDVMTLMLENVRLCKLVQP